MGNAAIMIRYLTFLLLTFMWLAGDVGGDTLVEPTPSLKQIPFTVTESVSVLKTTELPLSPTASQNTRKSHFFTLSAFTRLPVDFDLRQAKYWFNHLKNPSLKSTIVEKSNPSRENSTEKPSEEPNISSPTIFSSKESTSSSPITPISTISSEGQYFVSIKSDDCPKIRTNKFDQELSKALAALGVLNVTANIAKTKCQTQLSVNMTATAPSSAIKLLEQSRKLNLTITVFNRTFKIVDIQRLNPSSGDIEVFNSSPTIISVVAKNEFNGYIAVGVCFGLVLIVCLSVCCVKCWSADPNKRLTINRNAHSPLNPEDYTLTPLPRPTSLYVDYYRNSFSADMRSTTSAGSVGSASPIEEKVVQPFDTSIVPLEDFVVATITGDSRRNSVESNISHKSTDPSGKRALMFFNSIAHSKEKLSSSIISGGQIKAIGVSNPTYMRY